MAKEWNGAPFGCQSDRFNVKGLHPNMFSKTGHIPYESALNTMTVNLLRNITTLFVCACDLFWF